MFYYLSYGGFELRRGYCPLKVLFCNRGELCVCLRKLWDRCCVRCIVKFTLLIFVDPPFIVFNSEYFHEIIFLCGKLSYDLSISCPTNVSAWALKLPPSQKSVYFEIGVLTYNVIEKLHKKINIFFMIILRYN